MNILEYRLDQNGGSAYHSPPPHIQLGMWLSGYSAVW